MNLFIIGNGFDLSHWLPTSYNNFRDYLIKEYPNSDTGYLMTPESRTAPDGGVIYDSADVVAYLLRLISDVDGDEWRNLEYSLGYLDYTEIFDFLPSFDEEDNPFRVANTYEDMAYSLIEPTRRIKVYFSDWINSVNLSKINIKKDFKSLINPNEDAFLNFNTHRLWKHIIMF